MTASEAEAVARAFHEIYEEFAPGFRWRTQSESAVPWEDVPTANRGLMIATVLSLEARGYIELGGGVRDAGAAA